MKIRHHTLLGHDRSPVAFVATPNKSGKLGGGAPKFVVLHFTAGGTARGAINWFRNPGASASAHLVIDHDGAITQMARFDERLWHAGRSRWEGFVGLNSHSVGVEIVNWGALNGGSGRWHSWTGQAVPDKRVVEAAHRNSPTRMRGWEIFDEAQIEATASAVRAICAEYGLAPNAVIGHDDISPGRKTDPGPAWDTVRFHNLLRGETVAPVEAMEVFHIAAASGLNMRDGPGVNHARIKTLRSGAEVAVVERRGIWWRVVELLRGRRDMAGWVHSNWLAPV